MASQKKIMKMFVLIILAVFLLSTGLVSVMYFVDINSNDSENTEITSDIDLEITSGSDIDDSLVIDNQEEPIDTSVDSNQ